MVQSTSDGVLASYPMVQGSIQRFKELFLFISQVNWQDTTHTVDSILVKWAHLVSV